MNSLRFTETNSADDSQGRTWGLEGNLFWYLAGSGFASVITLLVIFSVMKLSLLVSVIVAVIPLILTLTYVFAFRQGKPAGYDRDCLDLWINGAGFGPEPQRQPKHPYV
jgi:Flp pilus assembly protein TadB